MILTLTGNDISIELSEPETYTMSQRQNIQSFLPLNPRMEDNFRYTLCVSKDISEPILEFLKNELIVKIPLEFIKNWVLGNDKSLQSKIHNALGEDFTILLKKGF